MSLYDGYTERKNQEKRNQLKKMVLVAIIIICLLIFVVMGLILYVSKQTKVISVAVNGKVNAELLQLLNIELDESGRPKMDEEGNLKIYAPIKKVAKFFGYEDYNGNYMITSEDKNSCNVRTENEVAIFTLDSDILYKKLLKDEKANYEMYKMNQKVFQENDELYINEDGLKKAFNISIFYNEKSNSVEIYTLDYYITYYTTENALTTKTVIQDLGYKGLDESFINQKAILDDMLVIKNEQGAYGVIDMSGEIVLGTQYESITYMPEIKSFLIQSNKKYGIISSKGQTQIEASYDNLQLIDSEKQLYVAVDSARYGVIDINNNVLVPLEYQRIGIDISPFTKNNITNGYIIQDKLIPVQQNQKWGFYNLSGQLIGEGVVYEAVGCITSNTIAYPILSIPECNAIVVRKNGKYGCIDTNGETLIGFRGDDSYIQITSGVTKYIITRNKDGKQQTINIVESLS